MSKKGLLDESVDLAVNQILDTLGLTIPNERRQYREVKSRLRAIIHVIRASILQLDHRHEKVLDHEKRTPIPHRRNPPRRVRAAGRQHR